MFLNGQIPWPRAPLFSLGSVHSVLICELGSHAVDEHFCKKRGKPYPVNRAGIYETVEGLFPGSGRICSCLQIHKEASIVENEVEKPLKNSHSRNPPGFVRICSLKN